MGSVLGSSAIAAFMQARLEANLPGAAAHAGQMGSGALPAVVAGPFSDAMAQSLLLPAIVMAVGVIVVLFMKDPRATSAAQWQHANAEPSAG
jgi:hypothetical protein